MALIYDTNKYVAESLITEAGFTIKFENLENGEIEDLIVVKYVDGVPEISVQGDHVKVRE
jgi:hypothetical protein